MDGQDLAQDEAASNPGRKLTCIRGIKENHEARIAKLMADNRERTIDDIALRLQIDHDDARYALRRMVIREELISEKFIRAGFSYTIWRKA